MEERYKIAIVDDSREIVRSLQEQLSYYEIFDVIFTANSGLDFIQKMENISVVDYPKVVLMDIEMPEMDGINAIYLSKIKFPFVQHIVLTSHDNSDLLFKAIQAGANGFLLKEEKLSVIKEHIINLLHNEATPMSPSIAKKTFALLQKLGPSETIEDINRSHLNILTTREQEVLELMIAGCNYKVISEKLYISTNTVRTHIAHIYEKLHINSKVQMMKLFKN
jgi:DNA-binding NarL/FixJ family response regulator